MLKANRWVVLVILSGALALVSLDNTIVNVALPRLQEDLGATTSQLQWVVDAYSVLFAGTLLLAGSLGDRFGRRLMLCAGIVVFIIASTLAALAPNGEVLVLARALMGVGGAFIMPSTLSILVHVFTEPVDRARAIGLWAAVAGVGIALGPIIGGLLLERFSWHAVFLVNPPVSVVILAMVLLFVPESADPTKPRLDLVGAVLSSVGLIALVFTIIELPESGISGITIASTLLAIALLGGFAWWERRAPRPLLPMSLFGSRLFSSAIIVVGLVYFALMGAMFFLPQFLQLVQDMTPLQSGLAVLPGALGLLVASIWSPHLAERVGTRRTVVSGLSLVVVAMLGMSTISETTAYAFTGTMLGAIGFGLGLALPQATNGVLASVPSERSGMGSAVNDAMGELGGSFGVAILGGVLSVFYRQHIEEAITAAGKAINEVPAGAVDAARESLAAASIASGQLPGELGAAYREVVVAAFVSGMTFALVIGAVVAALGVLLAWRRFPVHVEHVDE